MHFVTVEGRALKQALRLLVDTVDRRNTIPILGFVKLSLSDEGLQLEATDLDVAVSVLIDVAEGAGDWAACLPAHALCAMARVAGPMTVRIEPGSDGAAATVILGDDEAVYTLPHLPVGDFPEMMPPRGDLLERFGNGRLAEMLAKVSAFISTEETRYYLNGVGWQFGAFGSRFVATDGHRLAACGYDGEAREPASRIIPRKTIGLLAKHFAGRDVSIFAAETPLKLMFEADRVTLTTKLIDGTYPDIDRVISPCIAGAGAFTLGLKRPETLAAIARLSVFGGDIGRAIKFEGRDGVLSMERKGGGDGSGRVRTSVTWPEGLPPFGVNSVYFADVVGGCDGDVTLGLASASAPILVRDADPAMTRILMPMRV